jgi:hypothetical protein
MKAPQALPAVVLLFACSVTPAQAVPQSAERGRAASLPELCRTYRADRGALDRLRTFAFSEERLGSREALGIAWRARLDAIDFDGLPRSEQVDWLILDNQVRRDLARVALDRAKEAETAPLIPFKAPLVELLEARAVRALPDPRAASEVLHQAKRDIEAAREANDASEDLEVSGAVARRAASQLRTVRSALSSWYRFGAGYDPLFSWWCEAPWEELDAALKEYGEHLERDVGGLDPDDDDALVGDPIGREALLTELSFERVPYTPEELIAIADKQFEWCDARRREAAAELGFGDDFFAAQQHVRSLHVEPGGQPELIRELAEEAVVFLEDRDLITIPELAKESWRMGMMSPSRQKYSPYFTGGEVISISYPTDGMDHDAKMQSMRGNNIHFSRATVHHELIPGHHLQHYYASRWNHHRGGFSTPFYGEGWALYWEMRLWDMDFARGPEDEIGMLFWRSHRCARILFSLNYHLGNWSPEECVDFLVARVGHERNNATAEVRRSIQGGYGPLYQAAYMLGGLQLVALHKELVQGGGWSEREFHDAILKQSSIPIEYVRAAMGTAPLKKDRSVEWRFDD